MDTRAQDNRVVTQAGVGATLVGLGMLPGLVWLATLPANGPSGGFFEDRKRIDW